MRRRDVERAGASMVVDARGLRLSGIGRYLREVLNGVLRDPRFTRVTLLGRPGDLLEFVASARPTADVRIVPFAHPFYSPAAQLDWAVLAARGATRADVAFFPHYDVPLAGPLSPALVTVHDLTHFLLPDLFPRWKREIASVVLRRAVARARVVALVSAAVRDDLVARHPGVAPRARVIPNGADPAGPPPSAGVRAGVDALRPFLLGVGNRKPHKNWVAAVEVLARLRPRFPTLRLVLAGKPDARGDGAAERAAALGLSDAVLERGAVSDEELRALYGAAECLVFPSLFEGFGLPALEAMAAGTPVIASDRGSIPEVVGDAGFIRPPHDWDGMAADAARLMTEAELRAEMVARGVRHAASLTWADTARRTADALWEVASGAGP